MNEMVAIPEQAAAVSPDPQVGTARAAWAGADWSWVRLRKIVLPLVVLALFLAGWEILTASGRVSPLILASPHAIFAAFFTSGGQIFGEGTATLMEALTGFVVGNSAGLLIAILFIHSDLARRTIFPIAIGAEAIPIVAVVPVLILWLGNGMEPKMFITSFLTFFPMLVNAFRGLRSADAEVNELLYTLSATRWQKLLMVRLPASVPFLFAALKLSACAVVVAAIVGEWLASDRGLGHLIVLYGTQYKIPEVWATALVCTAMSLAVYGAVVVAERVATPWVSNSGTLSS
ncbi:MAG: ABC transporter permease [Devosia sp.]|nr:ABC transporter permease [Devosia sp.]